MFFQIDRLGQRDAQRSPLVALDHDLQVRHEELRGDLRPVRFIYLRAPRQVLEARLELCARHFAGPALLHSQLMDLEDPGESATTVDATLELDVLVPMIRRELGL